MQNKFYIQNSKNYLYLGPLRLKFENGPNILNNIIDRLGCSNQ